MQFQSSLYCCCANMHVKLSPYACCLLHNKKRNCTAEEFAVLEEKVQLICQFYELKLKGAERSKCLVGVNGLLLKNNRKQESLSP